MIIKEIDPISAAKLLKQPNVKLIDVREENEYNQEHISGSTLCPLSKFDPKTTACNFLDNQIVIFHCKMGGRSANACNLISKIIDQSKPIEIYNLTGGIEGWKKNGLPTVK